MFSLVSAPDLGAPPVTQLDLYLVGNPRPGGTNTMSAILRI